MAIHKKIEFHCSPQQLWDIVGTPDRVDWVPGVENCEFDGEVRSLSLPGAGFIRERILQRDEANMHLEYSCIESPAPIARHLASIDIKAAGDKTEMHWNTEVEPAALEPFIEASMEGAIVQLHLLVGEPS